MEFYTALPIFLISFWFLELPRLLFLFFQSFNRSMMHLLSLSLFLRTFFQPLKNEYRPGLVLFSIVFGIAIKTGFIIFDLLLLTTLIVLEAILGISLILLPLLIIVGVFVL